MQAVFELNRLIEYYHENRLSHAYLIETNNLDKCFADLKKIVKAINCASDFNENCSKCNLCNLLENNYLPSFIVIEPDGKNIKKEQILDLKSRFSSLPTFTKENIYIIKEAEKLNASSANTMLKFLEEPEDHIIGFFITNNANNVINTIRSRCEIISVKYNVDNVVPILEDPYIDIVDNYLQKIEVEKEDTIMYNKNVLLSEYSEREDINNIFKLILRIYQKSIEEKKYQKDTEFSKRLSYLIEKDIHELLQKEKLIIKYIDELNYNVNIELFLDKFIIELSGRNG